ncbi:MAG: rhodanese-like domain-containing protein [Saprospiraceae bacterium]|nr:rhodanese-like domain-containing protein [Saprospiraceae bacterium]
MKIIIPFCVFACSLSLSAQTKVIVHNPAFEKKLQSLLDHLVPELDCADLYNHADQYYILDTREYKEYEVSHLKNSRWVGYNSFDLQSVKDIPKSARIVCYCSVGYRSEKICEQLIKSGYQNVYNLYGSIFEWVNRGYPVVDVTGSNTNNIHVYNRKWGRWMVNPDIKKIY